MAQDLKFNIVGDDMQAVEIDLETGGGVRAEAGTMLYMEDGVEMETNAQGGVMKGLKRMVTGESFFITNFLNKSSEVRKTSFAAPYPGKIITLDLEQEGGEFICQRDSFLCGSQNVEVEIAFTKRLGAGFFGGEGFILQKLMGTGVSFIHAGGTVIEKTLSEGEKLHVDTGCLVGFSSSIDYDIKMTKGVMNMLFSGEGLFLAHLTGPGKVYLQSLPFSRMADRVLSVSSGVINQGGESTGAGGLGGKFVKGLISGN